MHNYLIKKGTTDVSVEVRIVDSTDGTPETGVVWNTAGIDLQYRRDGAASTAITEATLAALTTAHTDGGFLHIGNGVYRLDLPDAACASGVDKVVVHGTVTGMVVIGCVIQLTDVDLFDSVRAGLTALPNAAADAAGGLPVSDAGGLDLDGMNTNINDIETDTTDIQSRLPAALVGGLMDSNVGAISADTTAADNLESQYDGTGLTGDTYPARQDQVDSIAIGSSSISTIAESYTLTTGTQSSGTFTSTETRDGVPHQHTDTAGTLDLYYQFDVGGNGTATDVGVYSYLQGSNDSVTVYAYDWDGAAWDAIGTKTGTNSATYIERTYTLLNRHTGTGANLGKVRIRFNDTGLSSATLSIDQIYTSYAVVSQSVGYAIGRVWIDTVNGNAGTESFVNGVADNPVDTIASALTIMGNLNIYDMHITSNSTFAPSTDIQGYNVYGIGYTCTLGGHDYSGTHIYHASPVTGKATTTGGSDHFDCLDSIVGNIEVDDAHFTNCSFNGTITLDQVTSGDLKIVNSRSIIAGSGTPIIDCGVAAVTHSISIANWQNGIEIRNLNNGGTNLFSISGTGQLIVASTCSGTMNVRGQFKITDNSGGNVTFVYDDIRTDVESVLEDTGTTIPATLSALPSATDIVSGGAITTSAGAVVNVDTVDVCTTNTDMRGTDNAATETKQDATDVVIAELTTQGDTNETKLDTISTVVANLNKGIIYDTAATGTLTTTSATTNLTGYGDNQLVGAYIVVTTGDAAGERREITAYTETGGVIEFAAMTFAMSNGDEFKIV